MNSNGSCSFDQPIDRVLAAMTEHGSFPRRSGDSWACCCPAHEDRTPSLSISVGDDGRALLHCHVGCPTENVVAAIGLTLADLMPFDLRGNGAAHKAREPVAKSNGKKNGKPRKAPRTFARADEAIVALERQHGPRSALWTYHDAQGSPVGLVVRWDMANGSKDIRPASKTPDGWQLAGMPEPRPLYRLSDLAGAKRIYVTEGEGCVETANSIGVVATTSAHGSKSFAKTDWAPLAGKEVVLLPDHDEAGRAYVQGVAAILAKLVPPPVVKLLELPGLPPAGDIVDWIDLSFGDAAEPECIRGVLERLADKAPVWTPEAEPAAAAAAAAGHSPGSHSEIVIDPRNNPVHETMAAITDKLLAAGNCFRRADQLVAIRAQGIAPILKAQELAGLLNEHAEVCFARGDSLEYKPLPPAYATCWLNQHIEQNRFPTIALFASNPVFDKHWNLVSPGFNDGSGIYYVGPRIASRSTTEHIDAMLRDFCFTSRGDRTNYLGVLLTAITMPHFIGSKPAVLFNGNQPGVGKSILAQIVSIIRDGSTTETATYNPNDEEFEKRLGAIARRGCTTVIIDNARTTSRNPRIESACLERCITDSILSFRLLGESASIRVENSHLFLLTANAPSVGRDLVSRCVVVNLFFEGAPERRVFSIADPELYAMEHRTELLGELVGMVERWLALGRPMAKTYSRFNKQDWGGIVGGILEANGEPDFLANAAEAASILDETHRDFAEMVCVLVDHPQGTWTASELVSLCKQHGLLTADLGEGSQRSLATKFGALAGRYLGERFPIAGGRGALAMVGVWFRTSKLLAATWLLSRL